MPNRIRLVNLRSGIGLGLPECNIRQVARW